jgi:hypothetical protein
MLFEAMRGEAGEMSTTIALCGVPVKKYERIKE